MASNQEIIKWIKRVNIGILILALFLVGVPAVGSWWIARQLPAVSTVTIDNVTVVGATALCPGEPLIVEYDFHATGSGVLVRDSATWLVTPPKTMIYSTSRRFILDGPIDQHLRETWHVPASYLNYETEEIESLPSGSYRRHFAISSPSRSSVVAIASVEFTVKDCK